MHTYPKLTGQQSYCTTCRELFRSTCAFDKHRTGKQGVDRRCRSLADMEGIGMVRNAKGQWTTGRRPLLRELHGDRRTHLGET